MTIEQIPNKTELFSVDYRMEPTEGAYYGKSITALQQLCHGNEKLQKLAAACNGLASTIGAELTLYQTECGYAFVLYRHLFDVQEGQLLFLEQIAANGDGIDWSVSAIYAQTVCMTAWHGKNDA